MQKCSSFLEFLKNTRISWNQDRFYQMNEYIYYLPVGVHLDPSLHYIRTGLLMGRIRGERFEPSQALAMALREEDWVGAWNLPVEDPRIMKYLKGETIDAEDEYNGYRLICADHHPLGWIKQSGTRCKNKYYPGWRYN